MSSVIKGFINNIIVEGDVAISNKTVQDEEAEKLAKEQEAAEALSAKGRVEGDEEPEEERFTVDYGQLEALKEQYRQEGEEQAKYLIQRSEEELAKAKSRSDEMIANARLEASQIIAEAQTKAEKAIAEAEQSGFDSGFAEGLDKGTKEGYDRGVKKCQDTLAQLEKLCAAYGNEKNELMAENRRGIFDLSQEIAEKITMTVFTQKSKNILEKMIAAAAKDYRKAKNVRVTLSKLDITEEFIADSELLQKCFPSADNVEFEVLDNAERGTLMIEADSEILDAGVSTQLKMIGELGRGKFREKEPEKSEAKPIAHAPEEKKPAPHVPEEEKAEISAPEAEETIIPEEELSAFNALEEEKPEQEETLPEPVLENQTIDLTAESAAFDIEPAPVEEKTEAAVSESAETIELGDDLLDNMDDILQEAQAALEAATSEPTPTEPEPAADLEIDDSILDNMDDILGEAQAALAAAEESVAAAEKPAEVPTVEETAEQEQQEATEEKETAEPKKSKKKNKEE